MNRKSLIVAVVFLLTLLGGGYFFMHWMNGSHIRSFVEHSTNQKNAMAEQFLPSDIAFLISINTQNSTIQEYTNQLLSTIGSYTVQQLWKDLFQESGLAINSFNINYTQHIAPLAPSPRITLAVGDTSSDKQPIIYIGYNISNISAYQSFKEQLLSSETFITEHVNDIEFLTNTKDNIYLCMIENVLFITSQREGISNLVTTTTETSLFSQESFQSVISHIQHPHLAYLYIQSVPFINSIKSFLSSDTSVSTIQQISDSKSMRIIQAFGFSITPEEDGITVKSYAVGNQEEMKKMTYTFTTLENKASYLTTKLPPLSPLLFFETYNPKKAFENYLALNTPLSIEQQQLIDILTALSENIDAKKFFSLLEKGLAFAIQYEKNNLIPAITILIDISDHTDLAQQLITVLDEALSSLLTIGEASGMPMNFIKTEMIHLNEKEVKKMAFDLKTLLGFIDTLPLDAKKILETTKLSLSYGITGDNMLIITTADSTETTYNKTSLEQDSLLQNALQHLPEKKTQGLYFISGQNIIQYVDDVIAFVDILDPMTPEDQESYEKVANVIRTFVYVISSGFSKDYESQGFSFMKIKK